MALPFLFEREQVCEWEGTVKMKSSTDREGADRCRHQVQKKPLTRRPAVKGIQNLKFRAVQLSGIRVGWFFNVDQ